MLCWEKSSTFGVQSIDIDPIPCYGTTHADYFYGEIPCVRCLTKEEINSAYEENTGHLIVSEFKRMKKDVMAVPAVLCKNHGPFSWGKDAKEAVHNAVVLEEVAKMAYRTELIHPQCSLFIFDCISLDISSIFPCVLIRYWREISCRTKIQLLFYYCFVTIQILKAGDFHVTILIEKQPLYDTFSSPPLQRRRRCI